MMTHDDFCGTVTDMLMAKPEFTGLRVGPGHLVLDRDVLLAIPDGETMVDAVMVDFSEWENGAFEGMTPDDIARALTVREFKTFSRIEL